MQSGMSFLAVFDFPRDSFGIHASQYVIKRVVYLSCVGGVGGVDNGSRRDLAVHVRNGRINSEGAFRIPVGMGCGKSVHGRNMAGDSSGEPQIVEIRGYGESGRVFVVSAFE